MQIVTEKGLMGYNWLTGHLSDFGVVVQYTTWLYYLTSRLNKYARIAASLLPPIISTIHEYYPLFNGENVTDHTDTALFCLGWLFSMVGIYLGSRNAKKCV